MYLANFKQIYEQVSGCDIGKSRNEKEIFAKRVFSSPETPDNFIIAPVSLSMILTLAMSGSKAKTYTDFERILNVKNIKYVIEEYEELLKELKPFKENLKISQRIFINEKCSLEEEFVTRALNSFGVRVEPINCSERSIICHAVNDWLRNVICLFKIRNWILPASFGSETKCVVIDTLCFKSDWKRSFTKDMTSKCHFHLIDGGLVNVLMMYQKGIYR